MKTSKFLGFLASFGVLFSACTQEVTPVEKSLSISTEAFGSMEKPVWGNGNQISVYDGTTNNMFYTNSTTAVGTFKGKALETADYVVVSPYSVDAVFAETSVTAVVPAEQTPTVAGKMNNALVAVGKAANGAAPLKNVVGLVKVGVPFEGVTKIEFTSGEAVLAGGGTVALAGDPVMTVSSPAKKITLTGENGGTIATGVCYFAVLPQELNGYKVVYTATGGTFEVPSTDVVTVTRSGVAELAATLNLTIDAKAEKAVVVKKGDRVTINVNAGGAEWSYKFAEACDWLKEVEKTATSVVFELTKNYLEAQDLTAVVTFQHGFVPTATSEVTVTLSSNLLFDAQFNADGTAYDASKFKHTIEYIPGDYHFTYFNKALNKYIPRVTCTTPGGARSTSYYKFDYSTVDGFLQKLADGHTLECLCMLDQALDGAYNYEIKPFSSMQSGGTGFVIGKANNQNHMFFLPNTGSWNFVDTGLVMEEGVYYHLVGTFDPTNKVAKVYVNGKLACELATTSGTFKAPSSGSHWFAIGGDSGPSNCGEGWRGDVASAKIYDEVLDQDDVTALWNAANVDLPFETVRYDVVFFGDSITQYWTSSKDENRGNPQFFTDNNWYNRGISGNTTEDMLNRFKYDLELLAPKVMVLCAGTNDIAQNDDKFVSNEEILANIKTMVERAAAVGTKTILCSLLPADKYYWSNAIENPSQEIKKVNELIKAYAAENNIPYVDYWTPLHSETDGMPAKYSADGVHPNKVCYKVMEDIVKPVVVDYLKTIK